MAHVTDAQRPTFENVSAPPMDATDMIGASAVRIPDAMVRSIIDHSRDCIKVVELDGTLSFMNASGCRAMEVADFSDLAGRPWDSMWPEGVRATVRGAVHTAGEGLPARFEGYCPTVQGTPRWWDVQVSPVPGDDGQPVRMISVARDITDRIHRRNEASLHNIELRELADSQAETLRDHDTQLREVDHRLKNSLSMVASFLKMEERRTPDGDVRGTLQSALARVASIAAVHEQLYRGKHDETLDFSIYLTALACDLGSALNDVSVEVICEPGLSLHADQAMTLGLVVAEAVTNAAKHGSADDTCRVVIDCGRRQGSIVLTFDDDGCGLPDDFDAYASTGLGMRVLRTCAQKLDGTMSFETAPGGGARFRFVFPDV